MPRNYREDFYKQPTAAVRFHCNSLSSTRAMSTLCQALILVACFPFSDSNNVSNGNATIPDPFEQPKFSGSGIAMSGKAIVDVSNTSSKPPGCVVDEDCRETEGLLRCPGSCDGRKIGWLHNAEAAENCVDYDLPVCVQGECQET